LNIENTSDRFPDGSVWVRTHPVTYLFDHVDAPTKHAWHQLTYAVRGQLEVHTADTRALIPPDCAIWVPAELEHREMMRAPVSVRSLYLAPGALHAPPQGCRTVTVSPLLRELILHITRLGALDQRNERHARLIGVLIDLLAAMTDVPLQLPTPRDPRARRLVALIEAAPGDRIPMARLARRAGASLRTLERLFLEQTAMPVGEWRRRFRLFHALRLLEGGATVTDVAFEVGYANVSAFCTAFRRQFGTPPTRRATRQRA
jgi:AraC-like DNA-binding protein